METQRMSWVWVDEEVWLWMIRCAPGSLTNLGWLYRVFHVRRWGRAVSLGWCAGLEPEGLGGASFFGGEGKADVVRLPMCFLHGVPLDSYMQRDIRKVQRPLGICCATWRGCGWRYGMRKVPQVPCQLTSRGNLGKSFHSLWALFFLWPKGLILIILLALQRNHEDWVKWNKIWKVLWKVKSDI